jgi:hypothetical protein
MFEERRHLLADKETHRFVAGDPFNCVFVVQRGIAESGDGQLQNLTIKRTLAAKMIVVLTDRNTSRYGVLECSLR